MKEKIYYIKDIIKWRNTIIKIDNELEDFMLNDNE